MAEYKGKLLKGLFTQAKNVLLSNGENVDDALNTVTIVDEANVTSDTTLGSINFKKFSNGVKQVRIANSGVTSSGYTSGYIIPDAFKPKTSVTLFGVSWGGGNIRPLALNADGRISVYASTNGGLDITAIYI
jgi:hypothetical protein